MSAELTVLFVEDDAAVRRGGEQALSLAGLRVTPCADAEAAQGDLAMGRTGADHTPTKAPRAVPPSPGSMTWKATTSCASACRIIFPPPECVPSATETIVVPSFRRLPGIHATLA